MVAPVPDAARSRQDEGRRRQSAPCDRHGARSPARNAQRGRRRLVVNGTQLIGWAQPTMLAWTGYSLAWAAGQPERVDGWSAIMDGSPSIQNIKLFRPFRRPLH